MPRNITSAIKECSSLRTLLSSILPEMKTSVVNYTTGWGHIRKSHTSSRDMWQMVHYYKIIIK